ncbi:P-loop containing nucleoside triphosphate hydrolase protein [Suillus weaverae]|nr:P-loop containing nucleoside triphosphate hydrolase protein [Suillus weaverae]
MCPVVVVSSPSSSPSNSSLMLDSDTGPIPELGSIWGTFSRRPATSPLESDNEHIPGALHRPPTPDSPFIPRPPQSPWGDSFPALHSPVWQPPFISHKHYEEGEDHFVRRWQKWDQYGKQWVPDRYRPLSPSPIGIPGIDDYFYLNVRSMSQEGKFSLYHCIACILNKLKGKKSLVFSDFGSILESFLRTVFVDVNYDKPLEFPIHRLSQKMKVLRSKLDDARTLLDAEQLPEDLATKAEGFGFNASTGCEMAAEFVAVLVIHLGKLLNVVEAESKQTIKKLEELLSDNQISFDLLEYYFEEGKRYIYNSGLLQNGLDVGRPIILVVLKSARFLDDRQALLVELEHLEWDGVRFEKRIMEFDLFAFQGTRACSSLFLQPVTDEALAKVTDYEETQMQSVFGGNLKPRIRRVMIDPVGFHRALQGYNPHLRVPLPDNAEEHIARLPYWIGGYDLELNQWRTFNIWDLKPVDYDQEAWSNLIMDEDTKDLIRALVDNTGCSVGRLKPAQFNKGQTVLLKGPPGTGKMTTVHAVCNLLKRPLLTITITANDLLYDLVNLVSDIALRVSFAATWNAVIVVNDADRFLESKQTHRDRINTVLRQFESNDCISFWVSSTCDDTLLTRFSTVVDFPELDATARRRLWLGHFGLNDPAAIMWNSERTLISSSFVDQKGMDHSLLLRDIEKLSRHQLDGRMIDDIVRSARALATSNGEHLSIHHIKVVMKVQRLDSLPLWRKLTRILTRPAKVLHMSVVN